MGAHGGMGQSRSRTLAADFYLSDGPRWSIGRFDFRWLQETTTLIVMLNSMPLTRVLMKGCDEKGAKEASCDVAVHILSDELKTVNDFRESL